MPKNEECLSQLDAIAVVKRLRSGNDDPIDAGRAAGGEITQKIADEFFAIANGLKPDRFGWLTPVKVNDTETVTA